MRRVANATHNISYVEWDPLFEFNTVAFSALFDITADPYQQNNLWNVYSQDTKQQWQAELAKEFACRGHAAGDPNACS